MIMFLLSSFWGFRLLSIGVGRREEEQVGESCRAAELCFFTMSFLAVNVSPSSFWISHKPIALGLLHSAPAATSRLSYCYVAPLRPCCIRCRAQEEGETSVQGESRPKEINPSLSSSSSSETYGGWSSDEPDFEGNWKSGSTPIWNPKEKREILKPLWWCEMVCFSGEFMMHLGLETSFLLQVRGLV